MKPIHIMHLMLGLMFCLNACSSTGQASPPSPTDPAQATTQAPVATPTETPKPTEIPTSTPTSTLIPTATVTPSPTTIPFGGGNGYLLMMVDESLVRVSLQDRSQVETLIPAAELKAKLGVGDISYLRTSSISPDGSLATFWNCATYTCDTRKGSFYLFTTDMKKNIAFDTAGYPSFLGWSDNQDRLLYYLSSTMADEFFIVKTKDPGFGEVISLGRITDVTWAIDKHTLYAQRGNVVSQLDKDGKELKKFTCNYSYDCINDPSPDGKRWVGLPQWVSYGLSDPYVTFSNQDFTEKRTVKIPLMQLFPLMVKWLPDNQHVILYAESFKQFNYSYFRLDTFGIMDVETDDLQVVNWDIPESVAGFLPCGLSPDGAYVVFQGSGGRFKEKGRLLLSERFMYLIPVASGQPVLERITNLEKAWESCPTWMVNP